MAYNIVDMIFCIVVVLALTATSHAQNSTCLRDDSIQDIRLVDGTYGDFMGRVEIRFNGTWGTICDSGWSKSDADVVCRTLGYEESVCSVIRARFGQGPRSSPIWMTNVNCFGSEDRCLQDCSYIGLDTPIRSCTHSRDAGVICVSEAHQIIPPEDLSLVNSTTVSLTFRFRTVRESEKPAGADRLRYRLTYIESDNPDAIAGNRFFFPSFRDARNTEIVLVVTNLKRDTAYDVQLGVDFRYSRNPCFSYVVGPLTDPVTFRTNETARESMIPIRFTPNQGLPEFMGRVEVMFNGTWGTVCDDRFSTTDGHVFCRALGYHRAMCVPFFSNSLNRGPTLPIWLDDLNCPSSAEILEDCSHNGVGVHNCRTNRDEAVVVCEPGDDYFESRVSGITVTDIKASSASVRWDAATFPHTGPQVINQYRVQYASLDSSNRGTRTVRHPETLAELSFLEINETYSVTVQMQIRADDCFFSSAFSGPSSEPVNFTTIVLPPDGPPIDFHVIVLNSTAVEVQWKPPFRTLRNGDILGYTVFARSNNVEVSYDFPTSDSDVDMAVIINDFQPSTEYIFNVLAYNGGGNGPRSLIALPATTFATGEGPVIIRFGVNADGLDSVVMFTFRRGFQTHCGSARPNTLLEWFRDGERIQEQRSSRVYQSLHQNGTTILNIGSSGFFFRLNPCDGGVYTCLATDSTTKELLEARNFSLTIGTTPGRLNRPTIEKTESTSVQLSWTPLSCDGGHNIIEYNVRYLERGVIFGDSEIFYHIEGTNYTVTDLMPETQYSFSVQAVDDDGRTGSFSFSANALTLPLASTPPRDVTIRKITITIIEVSWREPFNSNGVIVQYTVYLIPAGVQDTRKKRNTIEPQEIVVQTVGGNVTAVNITLPFTDIAYNVRVTASIMSDEEINEGPESRDVFIPIPDPEKPVVNGLRIASLTNSSFTLTWDFPPPTFLPADNFLAACTSTVETLSPSGVKVSFKDSKEILVPPNTNRVTFDPVTPGTWYQCDVNAVLNIGPGEKSSINVTTLDVATGKVAYMQLKFGPVGRCSAFQNGDSNERLSMVKTGVINEVNKLCKCGLTPSNLQDDSFSCANGLVDQVVYRARILGNNNYNARDLVLLIDSWAASGNAGLEIGSFTFEVDSQCNATLDSLHAQDCTAPTPSPTSGISVGELATLIITLFMIAVLLVIVILLSIIFLKKRKLDQRTALKPARFQNEETDLEEEDKAPFAALDENSNEKLTFEGQPLN